MLRLEDELSRMRARMERLERELREEISRVHRTYRRDLVVYEGQGHGFFNFNVSFQLYQGTLNVVDDFLVTQGFIEPNPEGALEV